MSVQTRSTRVKAPAISDPDNGPIEALSTNEKAILNLSGRVGFDRPLEGSSVNHENDYYKILKFINETKFTFTDVDNENNKGLVHKCNSKHKCALSSVKWGHLAYLEPNSTNTILSTNPMGSSSPL